MPNTPTSAAMAPTVVANRDTLNHSTTSLETEPDRLQAEVGQAEEGSQIRTTEGSVEHIEALGMDGVGTSIIEGLDPCLQPHHPPFTGMSPLNISISATDVSEEFRDKYDRRAKGLGISICWLESEISLLDLKDVLPEIDKMAVEDGFDLSEGEIDSTRITLSTEAPSIRRDSIEKWFRWLDVR
ncbi:hypothetical protein HMPREF1485_01769 [Propionibacterium sp. HGH0353]|nr:hypothetical protein HMPREF1485_01769 [Propionibacterium sp. HGH0353]